MDNSSEHQPGDAYLDDPPPRDEAAIRARLEQSRRDITDGRVVPMEPVLERMRAVAERLRREKGRDVPTSRRPT